MAKKRANLDRSQGVETASVQPTVNSELETLRDLIFGNQARDLHLRIDELKERIVSSERDQASSLNRKLESILESTAAEINSVRQLIEARWEQDEQSFKAQIEKLSDTLSAQIQALQTDLNGQIETLAQEQAEKLRLAEAESRRRDEDVRQELLALTAWLDDKKATRHDLGEMLVNLGQQLQTGANPDAGSDE